jgi:hypothetical protein
MLATAQQTSYYCPECVTSLLERLKSRSHLERITAIRDVEMCEQPDHPDLVEALIKALSDAEYTVIQEAHGTLINIYNIHLPPYISHWRQHIGTMPER